MKKLILTLLAAIAVTTGYAKSYTVKSPDGKLTITVNTGEKTTWSINHGETTILLPSEIGMETSNGMPKKQKGKDKECKKRENRQDIQYRHI